eukprot:GHVH01008141.1.p1 GENE.GHVH01008141.1~~GHVH01008141.1.p1  ORF type:complete len:273 (-),score=25.80 GHVH01008141.1:294-1112(-)
MATTTDVYTAFNDDSEGTMNDQLESFIPMLDDSPLLYTCVTRDGTILAERLNGDGGNVRSCILALLQTSRFIDAERTYLDRAEASCDYIQERFSIPYGNDFVVHVVICDPWGSTEPLALLVVAEREVSIVTAFGYLQELLSTVCSEYRDQPEVAYRALQGSLQRDLDLIMEDLSNYWSSENAKVAPEVAMMQGQIQGVKKVMMSNLNEMIRRKDQIEVLVHKTELLENETISYRHTATSLRRNEWWKLNRWYFYLAGIFVAGLGILCLVQKV